MSKLADALKGGGKYLKWEHPGTSYAGTITDVAVRQARKYESTELDYWDDGNPKLQAVVSMDTRYGDPTDPDDDGSRQLVINLWGGQKKALMAACRAADIDEPLPGMTLTATHVSGLGNAKNPRVFAYTLTAGPSGIATALADPQPEPTTPPAAPAAGNVADIARELLAAGADTATVAKATGLPPTTVAALANALRA
jgi:hypothetical protein